MARPGKTFLALDVNYFDDPDVVELSDEAQLLDLRAMTLTKRLQSDGRLTRRQFDRIAPRVGGDLVGELVTAGIWIDKVDHLERRNWIAWNDSAEMIAVMSQGGKRGNHVRWHVKGKKPPDPKCQWCREEGLVSPSDREATSGASRSEDRGESLHRHREDTDPDAYKDAASLADTKSDDWTTLRAVAADLEQRVATVEEARSELEAAGVDERTIASVLSMVPALRSS